MAYLAAPFKTSGEFPIEERLVFDTKDEMISFGSTKSSCMPESYFCVCTETHKFYVYDKSNCSSVSGGWKEVEGSGQSEFTNDLLVTTSWGNIKPGTTITAGTNFEDVFTSALNTYISPSISVSLPNNNTLLTYPKSGEATATISNMKISCTAGTKTISSIAFYTQTNTSSVSWSGLKTTYNSTSAINKTITGNTTLSGWCSDGTTYGSSITVNFALPYYYGVSTTTAITDITTGTSAAPSKTTAETKSNLNFSCGDGKYIWFAYNNSFADLKTIIQGATDIKSQFTTTSATYNDKTMKVYVTTGLVTDDNTLSFNF